MGDIHFTENGAMFDRGAGHVSAPGLRLHPRTMQVQRSEAELGTTLAAFQYEHDLTDAEMARALAAQLDRVLKYVLRRERHPDDPDRKADEE